MFERLGTGWELAMRSWRVLKLDKELLFFPLLSGLACLVVLASFAIPLWNSEHVRMVIDEGDVTDNPLAYVVLFAFYFVNYFVIAFFNSGLVACAVIRFKGGDPTVSDGLRAASSRLPQIAGWAFVCATVGLILRVIESRSERAGQIVAAIMGTAWSIATYFVVPVLVVERVGPIQATKRSLSILRKTWGEAIGASFGIGFITMIGFLLALLPLVLGGMAISAGQVVLGGAGIALGVAMFILVGLASSALDAILLGALYLYAAEGHVSDQFDERLFRDAFTRR